MLRMRPAASHRGMWAITCLALLCLAMLPAGTALATPPGSTASALPPGSVAPGSSAGPAGTGSRIAGRWQGTLSFRGDDLALRLHLEQSEETVAGLTATLDVPELMMAWEPAAVSVENEIVHIEMPFGIGTFPLQPHGETIRAAKALGDDTMALVLHRDAAPGLDQENVVFRHQGIHLAGRLVIPAGEGPFPAIILVHGSGNLGRSSWSYASRADFLARLGYAVLLYDKRGVGESSPMDHEAGLTDLEQDVLAALAFLKERDDIDSSRLGLLGWSQGSWLSMKVAAGSADVAFAILGSAAAVTPGQQEMQKIETGMRDDGIDEEQIQDALAYYGLYFYVARTGEGWNLLERAMEQGQGSTWFTYVDQPRQLEDLAWWGENHDFQPRSYLPQIKVPVLALYGGADWMTPPSANAALLEDLIRSGGNQQVAVAVFPRADHRIELPMGADENGQWRWPRIAPAMLDTLADWLNDLGKESHTSSRHLSGFLEQ